MAKKKWSELNPSQQRAIVIAGVVESVMTAVALRDLRRRPSDEVRGPKAAWAVALFVQPVGPIAYFSLGRRRA